MKEIILAYQGEMALKGLNRTYFESVLIKNLRERTKSLGRFKIYKAQSTMFIEPLDENADTDEAFLRVKKVFGIAQVSRAAVVEADFEQIKTAAQQYLAQALAGAKTFKVQAKRADKTFALNTMEIMRELGAHLLDVYPHLTVDVVNPEVIVMVEVRDFGAYIHAGKQKGAGGMPVATSGRACTMLSGGIDSPVAAYMAAKRGLALTHVHFASPPYTSERAKQKVLDLADAIAPYTGSAATFVVPYADVQVYMRQNGAGDFFTVLMRRSMLRITAMLARKNGCEAIITGESLAQVASQTLSALICTDCAVDMPVLRPLIGFDKTEITALARSIGTFELSILPFEDCCTIFTPQFPKTHPKLEQVLAIEAAMADLPRLEQEAADAAEKILTTV